MAGTEDEGFKRSFLSLKVAREVENPHFHVAFHSIYGDGVVPVLSKTDGAEKGYYIEEGPWDWQAIQRCLDWLGLLRTSELEELPVEIRSTEEVPELVRFYAAYSQRNVFELVGHLSHGDVPEHAERNAQIVQRLAKEYLDRDLPDALAGLKALDALVVESLRDVPAAQMLPSTMILLGSFFGVVLRRRWRGEWAVEGQDSVEVTLLVRTDQGSVKINVFGKILKLYENGIVDSTYDMAVSIAQRLDLATD